MPGARNLLHRLAQQAARGPAAPAAEDPVGRRARARAAAHRRQRGYGRGRREDLGEPVRLRSGLLRVHRQRGQLVEQFAGQLPKARCGGRLRGAAVRGAHLAAGRGPAGGDLGDRAPLVRRLAQLVRQQVLGLDPGDPHAPATSSKAAATAARRLASAARTSRATAAIARPFAERSSRLAVPTASTHSAGTPSTPCSAPAIAPAMVAIESESRP